MDVRVGYIHEVPTEDLDSRLNRIEDQPDLDGMIARYPEDTDLLEQKKARIEEMKAEIETQREQRKLVKRVHLEVYNDDNVLILGRDFDCKSEDAVKQHARELLAEAQASAGQNFNHLVGQSLEL